jgi:hypothetical protein
MPLSHLNGIALSGLTAFDGIASISAINGISATLGVDATAPTLNSATVAANGTTLTLVFSESVNRGAGYADADLDVDASTTGSNLGLTYVSGDGTNTFVYTIASTIQNGETVDLDFNGDANSLEDGAGNDLAAIVSGAVTNNSTQGSGPTLVFTDNFIAADYTASQDINGINGWVQVAGSYKRGASTNEMAWPDAAAAYTNYTNSVSVSSDQRIEATYAGTAIGAANEVGISLRGGAYTVLWRNTTWTLYDSSGALGTGSLAVGDKMSLDVSGSGAAIRLKVQKDTGGGFVTESGMGSVDPVTDIDTGQPGLYGYDAGDGTMSYACLDDVKIYSL